jgi:hypothetical protein
MLYPPHDYRVYGARWSIPENGKRIRLSLDFRPVTVSHGARHQEVGWKIVTVGVTDDGIEIPADFDFMVSEGGIRIRFGKVPNGSSFRNGDKFEQLIAPERVIRQGAFGTGQSEEMG